MAMNVNKVNKTMCYDSTAMDLSAIRSHKHFFSFHSEFALCLEKTLNFESFWP